MGKKKKKAQAIADGNDSNIVAEEEKNKQPSLEHIRKTSWKEKPEGNTQDTCFRESQVRRDIEVYIENIRKEYLCEARIMPLLLAHPADTRTKLKQAGALLHCAMTSLRYNHSRRCINYLVSLMLFCERNFGTENVELADKQLYNWVTE